MSQGESRERGEDGFDVALIAANMEGWQLRQPDHDYKDRFILTRHDSNGHRLTLGLNPKGRYVHFGEHQNQDIAFVVTCRNIKNVTIVDGEIIFNGDVEYSISSNGEEHEVRLTNTFTHGSSVMKRSYEFKDPKKP